MASGALSTFQMTQDVIANRPAPAAYLGFWYATDQGTLYYSNGVTWITLGANDIPVTMKSGNYYFTNYAGATAVNAAPGNNSLRLSPFFVPRAVTLTRLGMEIVAVGDAGSTVRLGIYADDGTGQPGALLLDAGTIPGDAVAMVEIVINLALPAGQYWVGNVVQGAPVTQPSLRVMNNSLTLVGISTIPAAGTGYYTFTVTGVAGALPNPVGILIPSSASPMHTFIKVA